MSPVITALPTEVKIHGIKLESLFRPEFIGFLNQEFDNLRIEHFCMVTGKEADEDNKERLMLGYRNRESAKKSEMFISVEENESLNKLISILESLFGED